MNKISQSLSENIFFITSHDINYLKLHANLEPVFEDLKLFLMKPQHII